MTNLYAEYAELQAQIEALELKKSQLRPHIVAMMVEAGEEKVETGLGSFSVFPKKTWTYPDAIVALEAEVKHEIEKATDTLKAAKAKAESTGDATYEETPQLRFTPVKL